MTFGAARAARPSRGNGRGARLLGVSSGYCNNRLRSPPRCLLLLVSVMLAGCGRFGDKKQPLPGERISVLSLDRQLSPTPSSPRSR